MRLITVSAAALAALASLSDAFDFQHPLQSILDTHTDANLQRQPPNIIFILTDDQDLRLDSLSYMPFLQKHLQHKGTFYENHFVPTAICCPARVTLWTGRYAHNTNVTNVKPPYGGYPKFVEQGFNSDFLPVWLQSAGYNTYYTGKLFNAHTVDNYNSPHVAGFNTSDFLLDPYTYSYLNSTYQRDKMGPVSYGGLHTTDVITNKAMGLLDDGIAGTKSGAKRPFYLGIAPVAPHSNVEPADSRVPRMTAPIPAKRHEHLFKDVKVPRTPHFNPDNPSGVNWISHLPQQSDEIVEQNDHFYRQRLRALQGVDELVDQIVSRLEYTGVLENTYIIYTSDNGYHIGQHRLPPGKECGFEEDIRVPLFIRGPGIAEGYVEKAITAHVDLAPTILHLAGAKQRDDFDGVPVPLRKQNNYNKQRHENLQRREHANVEFWGIAVAEGEGNSFGPNNQIIVPNNTYKGLRLYSPESGYDLYYSAWCNNVHELYDLTTDPYQLHNIYPSSSSKTTPSTALLGVTIDQVINRLDALLLVLKSCRGHTCHFPWKVLHPDGNVETLRDALYSGFDSFYEQQVKVEYERCEGGYIIDAEGPQVGYKYLTEGDGLGWSLWE